MSDFENHKQEPYRVLARKYRPRNFEELIGQDALVRTLSNAIESGRIAHAFMLTGVRGVGKTTTARIIAKALNYKGPDGTSGPTIGPTDDCQLCKAITEDRHPDVIEMDAATRTGIDDIREILDGVRYAPTEARYKVYIIDEVHMLSKQAFNALLKTLEEPPEHVKFIFATTEIRKVPITVLSRCQRFDLRRVDVPTLSSHFVKICEAEGVKAEAEAIALIARAADGSVRDGLSLLDQAIALGGEAITGQQVQDMLGLADRARGLDLLEHALTGNMPEALEVLSELYSAGADPVVVIQDLLDLSHLLTKLRAVPEARDMKDALAADTVKRADELAQKLSMPTLGKTWQLLLKGLGEVQSAPNPQSAAEMVIIRLTYAADLPDPVDLIKKFKAMPEGGGGASSPGRETLHASAAAPSFVSVASSAPSLPESSPLVTSSSAYSSSSHSHSHSSSPPLPSSHQVSNYVKLSEGSVGSNDFSSGKSSGTASGREGAHAALVIAPESEPYQRPEIRSLEDVVSVLEHESEMIIASQVYQYAHLVKLEEGRIEIRPSDQAPQKLAQDLGAQLSRIMDARWVVSISGAAGAPTLAEQVQARVDAERNEILNFPVIKDILQVFPDAELTDITTTEEDK